MIRDTLGSWSMWFTDRVTDPRLVLQYQIEKLSDALERYKVNKIKAETELKKIDGECQGYTRDRDAYIQKAKDATNEEMKDSFLDAAYYLEVAIQTRQKQKELLQPIVDNFDSDTAVLREQIKTAEAKLKAVEAMVLAKKTVPKDMRLKNAEIDADIERVMRMAKRQNYDTLVAVNLDKDAWKKQVMS